MLNFLLLFAFEAAYLEFLADSVELRAGHDEKVDGDEDKEVPYLHPAYLKLRINVSQHLVILRVARIGHIDQAIAEHEHVIAACHD